MRHRRSRGDAEAGVTLIEMVITLVVVGITFAFVLGGIGVSIVGTDIQHDRATVSLLLTNAGEAVTDQGRVPYQPCATAPSPPPAPPAPTDYVLPPGSVPDGFSVVVSSVRHWDPGTDRFGDEGVECTLDSGLQLIVLTATSPPGSRGAVTDTLEVVRRRP